jgi:hypothetical protein
VLKNPNYLVPIQIHKKLIFPAKCGAKPYPTIPHYHVSSADNGQSCGVLQLKGGGLGAKIAKRNFKYEIM